MANPIPRLQGDINDTIGVMQENINKVSQRRETLQSLQDKTGDLSVSTEGFRIGTNRVQKLTWLKNIRIRVCLIISVILLIGIIALLVVTIR